MTPEKLISRQPLANGLTLEFWDHSRPMIGDRWIVTLEARVIIPVGPATLLPDLAAREAEVLRALGTELVFSQRDERNFIDAKEFEATLNEMTQRLQTQLKPYLDHPEFAGRFIRKKFAAHQEKQRWYRTRTQ